MSSVHVRQSHHLGKTAAKDRLASFEQMLGQYKVTLAWTGFHAAIQGFGVSGTVVVGDDAIDVNVALGMLARAAGVDGEKLRISIAKRLKDAYET